MTSRFAELCASEARTKPAAGGPRPAETHPIRLPPAAGRPPPA